MRSLLPLFILLWFQCSAFSQNTEIDPTPKSVLKSTNYFRVNLREIDGCNICLLEDSIQNTRKNRMTKTAFGQEGAAELKVLEDSLQATLDKWTLALSKTDHYKQKAKELNQNSKYLINDKFKISKALCMDEYAFKRSAKLRHKFLIGIGAYWSEPEYPYYDIGTTVDELKKDGPNYLVKFKGEYYQVKSENVLVYLEELKVSYLKLKNHIRDQQNSYLQKLAAKNLNELKPIKLLMLEAHCFSLNSQSDRQERKELFSKDEIFPELLEEFYLKCQNK